MTIKKLRIRHAGGSNTIETEAGASCGDVATLIASVIAIPPEKQVWKLGFPPKIHHFNSNSSLPSDLDLIHVAPSGEQQGSIQFVVATGNNGNTVDNALEETNTALSNIIAASSCPPPLVDPDGFAVRRVMDADNSCLFHSVGYAIHPPSSRRSASEATALRKMVANAIIRNDNSIQYSEAVLGRPSREYVQWIQQSTTWGGQIELSVLSTVLQCEIVAFDVIRNRHDSYNNGDCKQQRRIFVIYDGIHYDAIAYCLDPSLPEDMDVTQFSPNDDVVFQRAQELCEQQHKAKAFTDVSNFTLRCLVCQQGLKGQGEAQSHAQSTGHHNFAEFR